MALLATAVLIGGLLILVVTAANVHAATGTKTLRDDATGGDCTSIGNWDNATKTCTLTTDFNGTVGINDSGITLDGDGHMLYSPARPRTDGGLLFNVGGATVRDLTVTGFINGIRITGGGGNLLICNLLEDNGTGIVVESSEGNTISLNTISGNDLGIDVSDSADNVARDNIFLNNTDQASDDPALSNTFTHNYFDVFDSPAEGCSDTNGDGYCDAPFAVAGNSDDQPRTSAAGCEKPDLRLFKTATFWASYSDYTSGTLSVSYSIHNNSLETAYETKITSSTGSGSVTCLTAMPVALGTISGGGAAPATLTYSVPPGLGNFIASVFGEAKSACGTVYTYPI